MQEQAQSVLLRMTKSQRAELITFLDKYRRERDGEELLYGHVLNFNGAGGVRCPRRLAFWKEIFAQYLKEKPNQAQLLRDLGVRGTLGVETLDDIVAKNGYSERKIIYRVRADSIYHIASTIYVQGRVIAS